MKKIIAKRLPVNSSGETISKVISIHSVNSNGFLAPNPSNISVNKDDYFFIKDNTQSLKREISNTYSQYWELHTALSGAKKYFRVEENIFDVFPVNEIINNKNKVQYVTAFDGIDLSNTENLDSSFDGFFE